MKRQKLQLGWYPIVIPSPKESFLLISLEKMEFKSTFLESVPEGHANGQQIQQQDSWKTHPE